MRTCTTVHTLGGPTLFPFPTFVKRFGSYFSILINTLDPHYSVLRYSTVSVMIRCSSLSVGPQFNRIFTVRKNIESHSAH